MPKVRWVMLCGFVENFTGFPAVQKFWKSDKIWQSYREFKRGNFFDTQCISYRSRRFFVGSVRRIDGHSL